MSNDYAFISMYLCPGCFEYFSTKDELTDHTTKKHPTLRWSNQPLTKSLPHLRKADNENIEEETTP